MKLKYFLFYSNLFISLGYQIEKYMRVEIEKERKFLLKNIPNPLILQDLGAKFYFIEQFYTKEYRFRKQVRQMIGSSDYEENYYRIKKTSISEGVNREEIDEIDEAFYDNEKSDFLNIKLITKFRTEILIGNYKIHIDDFTGSVKMVVMEVENIELGEDISSIVPEEISKLILIEVTSFKQFSNQNLSK